jgi:hypothetical protein
MSWNLYQSIGYDQSKSKIGSRFDKSSNELCSRLTGEFSKGLGDREHNLIKISLESD